MAEAVTSRWVYPTNWDGSTYSTGQLNKSHVLRLTNLCDGTGESAVVKINISDHLSEGGTTATVIVIEKIEFSVQGFTTVTLLFDHTTDVVAAILVDTEFGVKDWSKVGGIVDNGSGGAGDLLLTTTGDTAGDTYDITITYRAK
jgi:hypothetical protein